jgi:hypothetical protein
MSILYTAGARTAADVDILPDTYVLGHQLVGNLLSNVMNLILNVKLATSVPNCPRVLLNAAWAFEAGRLFLYLLLFFLSANVDCVPAYVESEAGLLGSLR